MSTKNKKKKWKGEVNNDEKGCTIAKSSSALTLRIQGKIKHILSENYIDFDASVILRGPCDWICVLFWENTG